MTSVVYSRCPFQFSSLKNNYSCTFGGSDNTACISLNNLWYRVVFHLRREQDTKAYKLTMSISAAVCHFWSHGLCCLPPLIHCTAAAVGSNVSFNAQRLLDAFRYMSISLSVSFTHVGRKSMCVLRHPLLHDVSLVGMERPGSYLRLTTSYCYEAPDRRGSRCEIYELQGLYMFIVACTCRKS